MSSLSPDLPGSQPLAGQLVVFTGKLSSLGRKDARALVVAPRRRDRRRRDREDDDARRWSRGLRPGAERDKSNKLKRAEELNAQVRDRIVTEDEFCRLAGVPTLEALKQQYHAMRDLLARYRSLREDHLRYLVKCGVIRPVLRTNADTFFAFPDLAVIKQANDELEPGRVVPQRRASADGVARRGS